MLRSFNLPARPLARRQGELQALGTSENGDDPAAFRAIQDRLGPMYRDIFFDDNAPRTVLVVPSLSLHREVLAKISGVHHYEERMLCLLLLLRLPRTEVIFLTSKPVRETIIDYYLHMLPGMPAQHARRRLKLFSCHDGSAIPLTEKLLARPRLLARIRQAISDPARTHMTCFNVTARERRLALALDIPLYGCDPDLIDLGSKSGSRKTFREAGIQYPEGAEDLRDAQDVSDASNTPLRVAQGLGPWASGPSIRRTSAGVSPETGCQAELAFENAEYISDLGADRAVSSIALDLR